MAAASCLCAAAVGYAGHVDVFGNTVTGYTDTLQATSNVGTLVAWRAADGSVHVRGVRDGSFAPLGASDQVAVGPNSTSSALALVSDASGVPVLAWQVGGGNLEVYVALYAWPSMRPADRWSRG